MKSKPLRKYLDDNQITGAWASDLREAICIFESRTKTRLVVKVEE